MIGTGERSQFGEVFKMMQAEEVRTGGGGVGGGLWFSCELGFEVILCWGHQACPLLRNEDDVANVSSL